MFVYNSPRPEALVKHVTVKGSVLTIYVDSKSHGTFNKAIFDFVIKNKKLCELITTGEHLFHDHMAHGDLRGIDERTIEHYHIDFAQWVKPENIIKLFAEIAVTIPNGLNNEEVTALVKSFDSYQNSMEQMKDLITQFEVGMQSIMFYNNELGRSNFEDPYSKHKCPVSQKVIQKSNPSEDEMKKAEETKEFKLIEQHTHLIKKSIRRRY